MILALAEIWPDVAYDENGRTWVKLEDDRWLIEVETPNGVEHVSPADAQAREEVAA